MDRPPALPVVEEHRGRAFTPQELTKFFEACNRFPKNDPGRYTPLFLLMLCTGARPAELLPPKKEAVTEEEKKKQHKPSFKNEIDFERWIVSLRSCKCKPGARRTKVTPIEVVLPVLEMVKKVAEMNHGPHVFRRFSLKNYFDRILEMAGLDKEDELGDKLTAHSFRHTYGTIQAEAGVNAFVLQHLMRHSDPRMTARYTERALKGAAIVNPLSILAQGGRLLPPPKDEEVEK